MKVIMPSVSIKIVLNEILLMSSDEYAVAVVKSWYVCKRVLAR